MSLFCELGGRRQIKGWKALIEVTMLTRCFLDRAIGLYGFPKPRRVWRESRALYLVWDEDDVKKWLTERARIGKPKNASPSSQ